MTRKLLASALVMTTLTAVLCADLVKVPGSNVKYLDYFNVPVAGKTVKMKLTGTALRTKNYGLTFNVYTIGSYIKDGVRVRSATELANIDCPKRLHLVMERTIEGKELADAFEKAIRLNFAAPKFNAEIDRLSKFLRSLTARKGEHILLTHNPGIGLQCNVAGKVDFLIKNAEFSKAVWHIYLGQNNLGENIKRGLVSRL